MLSLIVLSSHALTIWACEYLLLAHKINFVLPVALSEFPVISSIKLEALT